MFRHLVLQHDIMNKPWRDASFSVVSWASVLDSIMKVALRDYTRLWGKGLFNFSACCNREDLSLSLLHSQKQNKTGVLLFICNPRADEAETDGYLELAIEQLSQLVDLDSVSADSKVERNQGRFLTLLSSHMHTQKHISPSVSMHIQYTHTHNFK